MAHSMGGPVSLYFFTKFNRINQAWKDKFIHAYIPIAGAWNGAVTSLEAVISGTSISFLPSFINKYLDKILVPIARSLESFPWLTPTSSIFGNKVIVSTPSKQYTANDYEKLFWKIGHKNGYQFFKRVQPLLKNYPQPNVKTHCYYGVGLDTPIKLTYNKDFRQGVSTIGLTPKFVNGDGDGTVSTKSSIICQEWPGAKLKRYNKFEHKAIVTKKDVLDDIHIIVKKTSRG